MTAAVIAAVAPAPSTAHPLPRQFTAAELLLACARALAPVREEPPGSNRGQMVEAMQKLTGGAKGDPWCADDVAFLGRAALGDAWPLPLTGSCEDLRAFARRHEVLVTKGPPRVGMLCLLIAHGRAEHVGIVRDVYVGGGFGTWEGNTSAPKGTAVPESIAQTRDGWGHFPKQRGPGFDHLTWEFIDWEALL